MRLTDEQIAQIICTGSLVENGVHDKALVALAYEVRRSRVLIATIRASIAEYGEANPILARLALMGLDEAERH